MLPRILQAVLLLAALLCAGCGRGPGTGAPGSGAARARETAAEQATTTSAPSTLADSLGSTLSPAPTPSGIDPAFETFLAALHDVEVVARVDGEIVALEVEEGARVTAGQPLARIDDRERRATLDEREAQVTRAEAAWQRAQSLHEQKLIADESYLEARADWQVARAQRDRARLEWERCTVRATIPGVVAQRRTQLGHTVKEGDALFRVSDPDLLRAELLLPESRLGTVHAGQSVTLIPVAGGPPTRATITRVTPLVDPASGTFRVTIDLDNRRARLPAGVTARVVFGPARAR
jgi:membrane fusion protein (multidrug efflux system)